MHKYKLVILDRDGVINYDSAEFIKSPREWIAIPGSLAAIAKLNHANYKVAVATNQSGIARGYFTLQDLEAIHQKMREELEKAGGSLDAIFICPHGPDDDCNCRKPKPGLILQIANHFKIDMKEIISIGDSLRDILAAKAAGCTAVLIKTGNGKMTATCSPEDLKDVLIFEDLADAVENILKN